MTEEPKPEEKPEITQMSKHAKIILAIGVIFTICLGIVAGYCNLAPQEEPQGTIFKLNATQMFNLITNSCKCIPIIDVRTPEEFATGHINRSVNINWNDQTSFTRAIAIYNHTAPIIVYCGIGKRSENASNYMLSVGFVEIYDLQGGLTAWKAQGYPVMEAK